MRKGGTYFGVVISELARDGLTAGAISKRHNPEAGGCRKEYFGVVIWVLLSLFFFFFFSISRGLATGATSQCSSGDLSI
jgi:hypothetical protein